MVSRLTELVGTMIFLAICLIVMNNNLNLIEDNQKGIQSLDKVSVRALNSNEPAPIILNTADVAIMMFIQDEACPYPAAIQINDSPAYLINDYWVKNKVYCALDCYNTNVAPFGYKDIDTIEYIYGGTPRWKINISN